MPRRVLQVAPRGEEHCRSALFDAERRGQLTGNQDYITRADAVLRRLQTYMHAGGEGVPIEALERASAALHATIRASLL
jgi:hypothetical protein